LMALSCSGASASIIIPNRSTRLTGDSGLPGWAVLGGRPRRLALSAGLARRARPGSCGDEES
jgi:hypothetical protein